MNQHCSYPKTCQCSHNKQQVYKKLLWQARERSLKTKSAKRNRERAQLHSFEDLLDSLVLRDYLSDQQQHQTQSRFCINFFF